MSDVNEVPATNELNDDTPRLFSKNELEDLIYDQIEHEIDERDLVCNDDFEDKLIMVQSDTESMIEDALQDADRNIDEEISKRVANAIDDQDFSEYVTHGYLSTEHPSFDEMRRDMAFQKDAILLALRDHAKASTFWQRLRFLFTGRVW